ncbi:MAG: HdeD family acid-resistance protein [Pseudorhodoplanes sp.]
MSTNLEARRDATDAMRQVLARNWWALALRGVLGILFGVIAFAWTGATMLSLVLLFSAYMLVDGVFAIIAAVRAAQASERWGLLALEGVADIATGVIAFVWPGITLFVFIIMIAVWALISGGLMLGAAFRLDAAHGRWWLVLGGIASIIYGAALLVAPMIGAVVLTWWIGAYAIVFGVSLLILAFQLRSKKPTPA